MTTLAIRKKLQDYIAQTDDEKVKGLYLLLKDEIESKSGFRLSSRHREILDAERDTHKKGLSRSFSLEEAIAFAKGG